MAAAGGAWSGVVAEASWSRLFAMKDSLRKIR
jgi:hypothetical protein